MAKITKPTTEEQSTVGAAPTALETADLKRKQADAEYRKLLAQQKLDRANAKAAMQQSKKQTLDQVVADQLEHAQPWMVKTISARTLARVKAGQPQDEALDEVLACLRAWTVEAIAARKASKAQKQSAK